MDLKELQVKVDDWIREHGERYFNAKEPWKIAFALLLITM